ELDRERPLGAADLLHLGVVPDVHIELAQAVAPRRQDLLAAARGEFQVAAQIQEPGLGHHVLALLVALDGLGVGAEALEQDVAGTAAPRLSITRCRARGSAQAGRTGADDCDVIHAETSAPALAPPCDCLRLAAIPKGLAPPRCAPAHVTPAGFLLSIVKFAMDATHATAALARCPLCATSRNPGCRRRRMVGPVLIESGRRFEKAMLCGGDNSASTISELG